MITSFYTVIIVPSNPPRLVKGYVPTQPRHTLTPLICASARRLAWPAATTSTHGPYPSRCARRRPRSRRCAIWPPGASRSAPLAFSLRPPKRSYFLPRRTSGTLLDTWDDRPAHSVLSGRSASPLHASSRVASHALRSPLSVMWCFVYFHGQ
jgi:hypothetical protein